MVEYPRVRLSDAITHLLLALLFLLYVDTAERPLLRATAIIVSMALVPVSVVIIIYKLYEYSKRIESIL
jgi:hypothetical protein